MQTEQTSAIRAIGIGTVLFLAAVGLWQCAAVFGWLSDLAPTPTRTASRAIEILSNPFYRDGPSSVGIFWHLITSLRRVV